MEDMEEKNPESGRKRSAFECGDTDEDKVKRFVAGSAVATLAQVVGGLFGFVWMIVLTRIMSESHFGVLGPFLQAFWIISGVISFGIPQAVGTYMSHNMDDCPDRAHRFGWEGMRASIFLGVGASTLIALLAVGLYFGGVFPDSEVLPSWVWLGWFLALAFTNLGRQFYFGAQGIFMGVQRIDFFGYCQMVFPIVYCAGSVGLVFYAQGRFGAESPAQIVFGAFGIGIGAMASFVLAVFLFNRMHFKKAADWFKLREPGRLLGTIIRFGVFSAMAITGYTVIKDIGSLLVMYLASGGLFAESYAAGAIVTSEMLEESLKHSGYFASAIMYSQTPMLVIGLVSALIPAMSQAHAAGNFRLMQKMYELAMKYVLIMVFGIITAFSIGAGAICELASDYPAAEMYLMTFILVTGGSIGAVLFLHANMFFSLKRPVLSAVLIAGVLVVEIPTMVVLSLMTRNVAFAAVGFAGATLLGFLVSIGMVGRLGLRFPLASLLLPSAAGLVSWFAMSRIWPPHTTGAGLGMALGVGLYALIIFVVARLTGQEMGIGSMTEDAGMELPAEGAGPDAPSGDR